MIRPASDRETHTRAAIPLLCALLLACVDEDPSPVAPPAPPVGGPASVLVEGAPFGLLARDTARLTAAVKDVDGLDLTDVPITWSTSDPSVATVDASGLLTALGRGQVELTARAATASGIALISVDVGFVSLLPGVDHACAVTASGVAYCWGSNTGHQLGVVETGAECLGAGACSPRPVRVTSSVRLQSGSGGWSHSCALDVQGRAHCWGSNYFGELGTGDLTVETSPAPLRVTGGYTFASLDSGAGHVCALDGAGAAFCWGLDFFGELGRGSLVDDVAFPTPAPVVGGHVFTSIASGNVGTCGLTASGAAFCWGLSESGQIGNGEFPDSERFPAVTTPTAVASTVPFTHIGVGSGYACALTADGSAWCWGCGCRGKLGNGSLENRAIPTPVAGSPAFRDLSVGAEHACGLSMDGSVWCWGNNSSGQLGVPATGELCEDEFAILDCSSTPVRMAEGPAFTTVAALGVQSCGLDPEGAVFCWGGNGLAQLGRGSIGGSSSVPIRLADPT